MKNLKIKKSQIRNRHNKNAIGFSFTDERRKELTGKIRVRTVVDMDDEHKMFLNRLNLFGTGDMLTKRLVSFYTKKVRIESKIDTGFYKEVYILTDSGKKRLKTLRRMRESKTPFWDYMSSPINIP